MNEELFTIIVMRLSEHGFLHSFLNLLKRYCVSNQVKVYLPKKLKK